VPAAGEQHLANQVADQREVVADQVLDGAVLRGDGGSSHGNLFVAVSGLVSARRWSPSGKNHTPSLRVRELVTLGCEAVVRRRRGCVVLKSP
jgi:hypothetical protein